MIFVLGDKDPSKRKDILDCFPSEQKDWWKKLESEAVEEQIQLTCIMVHDFKTHFMVLTKENNIYSYLLRWTVLGEILILSLTILHVGWGWKRPGLPLTTY